MRTLLLLLVLLSTLLMGACEIAGDIFKAGFWVGIVAVVLIVAGIVFLGRKMMG